MKLRDLVASPQPRKLRVITQWNVVLVDGKPVVPNADLLSALGATDTTQGYPIANGDSVQVRWSTQLQQWALFTMGAIRKEPIPQED